MSSYRPTWVEIDGHAFCQNALAVSRHIGSSTPFIAVLKANGYGHGAVPLAKALSKTPKLSCSVQVNFIMT